ncbi:MAG: imidazole glycerol phosphate synthase subunit HisH, partial [Planctomycetota bacterium]|jgi:glutamine amidotransferase
MIGVIDYGIGNLRSVQKALQRVGGDAQLVTTPEQIAQADKIVLPGVAAFGDAMEQFRQRGLIEPVRAAIARGTPYLGFCLGLQLLFETSSEDGDHAGLGVLPGKVVRFDAEFMARGQRRLAVPHMGWNQLHIRRACPMLQGIADGDHVYFAHSYHVVPADEALVVTTTDYGYDFVSSVARDNVFATQFHPEKSQAVGLRLLENFVRL